MPVSAHFAEAKVALRKSKIDCFTQQKRLFYSVKKTVLPGQGIALAFRNGDSLFFLVGITIKR